MTLSLTPSTRIAPTYMLVAFPSAYTVNGFSCSGFVGFTGLCSVATTNANTLNVSGMTGTSAI